MTDDEMRRIVRDKIDCLNGEGEAKLEGLPPAEQARVQAFREKYAALKSLPPDEGDTPHIVEVR